MDMGKLAIIVLDNVMRDSQNFRIWYSYTFGSNFNTDHEIFKNISVVANSPFYETKKILESVEIVKNKYNNFYLLPIWSTALNLSHPIPPSLYVIKVDVIPAVIIVIGNT